MHTHLEVVVDSYTVGHHYALVEGGNGVGLVGGRGGGAVEGSVWCLGGHYHLDLCVGGEGLRVT